MGCFYVGYNFLARKNGVLKIGETCHQTPAQRLQKIRQQETFECLGYLILKNETYAERLFIESFVRLKMANIIEHRQNDHFTYEINENAENLGKKLGKTAIEYAIECCEQNHIIYTIGTRKYARR